MARARAPCLRNGSVPFRVEFAFTHGAWRRARPRARRARDRTASLETHLLLERLIKPDPGIYWPGTLRAGAQLSAIVLDPRPPSWVPRRSIWKSGLSPLRGGGVRWSLWAADGLWVDAWATRRVVHPAIHRRAPQALSREACASGPVHKSTGRFIDSPAPARPRLLRSA